MLDVGKERIREPCVEWVCGDAQDLPFPDDSFDACTIAFGIRNVPNIDKVGHEDIPVRL